MKPLPDKPPRGSAYAVLRMTHVCGGGAMRPALVMDPHTCASLSEARARAARIDYRLTPTVVLYREHQEDYRDLA